MENKKYLTTVYRKKEAGEARCKHVDAHARMRYCDRGSLGGALLLRSRPLLSFAQSAPYIDSLPRGVQSYLHVLSAIHRPRLFLSLSPPPEFARQRARRRWQRLRAAQRRAEKSAEDKKCEGRRKTEGAKYKIPRVTCARAARR